jgi:transcriptional regulator with XRE-family HTH domain
VTRSVLLHTARQRAGLTQADLAERLGTTQSAVARWEKGLVSPRLVTFERILAACGFELRISLAPLVEAERDQIRERLLWTPKERLDYLKDMLAFEERAHRARIRDRR